MANLNLSQFTEKTFVADADWTFVWDTAGLISKKVSRNNWLNSGELTTSAPVTISQTWNAVAQTFKALVVNAAGTSAANSASGSLLLDLQVGGVSKFAVDKTGSINIGNGEFLIRSNISGANEIRFLNNGLLVRSVGETAAARFTGSSFSAVGLSLATTSALLSNNPGDVRLERDDANTLALRNGTNAQTFNVYGTYTSGSVYERMFARYDGTALAFQVGTQHVGATARPLQLLTDNAARMTIGTTGNVGIGTTAPAAKLEVVGASSDILSLKNAAQSVFLVTSSGGAGSVQISHANSPSLVINQSTGNKITLGVGSNNLQVLNSSNVPMDLIIQGLGGNVGIGTTAPSSKLHVVETWNNAGTTFCAIKSVITDTNSAAGSDFLELYAGTSTQPLRLDIQKTGQVNIYGTWTDSSNYERLSFSAPTAGNAIIGTNRGSGSNTARGLNFQTDGANRWFITSVGDIGAASDNTYDIGASGANRPRNLYVVNAYPSNIQLQNGEGNYGWIGRGGIFAPSNGVVRLSDTSNADFNRLQFGGTTASFPAIKRSSTTLQVRLADDSAFAPIQGKLTTDTAFTSGAITDTGYIVLYDSTGTAYKVACTPV